MTTIVVSFKELRIVADRQMTRMSVSGGTEGTSRLTYFEVDKIFEVGDGIYLTGAGCYNSLRESAEFYKENGILPDTPNGDLSICIVRRKGDTLAVDVYESELKCFKRKGLLFTKKEPVYHWGLRKYLCSDAGHYTLGSGGRYAMGALNVGATPEAAIRAAAQSDVYTGTILDSVSL